MNYSIDCLELELTDTCNAACPMCMRTNVQNTKPTNTQHFIKNQQLSFDRFKTIIDINPKPSEFVFCGNFGDPAAVKDFLKVISYIADRNTRIVIHTNAGLRNIDWWQQLGEILSVNYKNTVVFGIDGLEDTHSFYRRHTDFNKVIDNATSFIDNTLARSTWSFIKFKHNEHQIGEAKDLSKKIGFTSFVVNYTSRFAANNTNKFQFYEDGQQYFLEPPTIGVVPVSKPVDHIECIAIANRRAYLSSEGLLWPCCWIETSYRARFDPFLNQILDTTDLSELDASIHSFESITNSTLFKDIKNRWVDMQPQTCYTKCGRNIKNIRQEQ